MIRMNTHPAHTRPIGTTTGGVAILAKGGDNPLGNGDVSRPFGARVTGPAPAALLPTQVTVRPANSAASGSGRQRVWCDAVR